MMTPTKLNTVHRWNALLCPPIGFAFNFLLIWLVLKKTPKEMQLHSRILLQTGILDILVLLMNTIGQPIYVYQLNTLTVLFEGYFIDWIKADQDILLIFYCLWFMLYFSDIYGLVVQFFYRYLILNRNIKINLSQYIQMLSLVLMSPFIFSVLFCIRMITVAPLDVANKNGEGKLSKTLMQSVNGSTRYMVRTWETMFILDYIFMSFSLICYAIIACCTWKISKYVNANLTGPKKALSKQLTRNLVIMAILPFFNLAISTIFIIVNIFSISNGEGIGENDDQQVFIEHTTVELLVSMTVHWLPVLNPLISILTNTPYRRALVSTKSKITTIIVKTTNVEISKINNNLVVP